MKTFITILLIAYYTNAGAAQEWLHNNILYNDTNEPYLITMRVDERCEVMYCYHNVDIVSVERPADIKRWIAFLRGVFS